MDANPLLLSPIPEVYLPNAPLVRVVTQVRFPLIASIEKREFIGPFQEAIRGTYSILRQEQTQGLLIGPQGIVQTPALVVWRFGEPTGKWRVSLSPEFLALETTAYISHDDFLERLRLVLVALGEHVAPAVVDRVGVRYIDRVTGDVLRDIAGLIRPEVRGVIGTDLGQSARHSLSESLFVDGDGKSQLLARWGKIPENGTVDPAALEPIPEPSWILDLDMFHVGARPFDSSALVSEVRRFTERIYAFFRWAVTDEFLRRYGGQV